MSQYTPPEGYGDLTITEKIPLWLRIMYLAPRMSATALYHPFSSSEMSLRRALWRTYVSTMCYNSTVRQLQNVLPNTGSLYAQWQRSQPGNPPVVSENISSGASLHWLGPKSNKKVMLYIAGGGFVLPAVGGHFRMLDWWQKEAKKRHGIDFSIALLEYDLSNFAPWPTQLVQASAGLEHLLKEGYDPSNITIVGDSVGGTVIVFLLAHLIHKHPAADAVQLNKPLAGAAALSPWLCYGIESNSWKKWGHTDDLPLAVLLRWSGLYKATRTRTDDDYYFEPALAPYTWWAGLEKVAQNVILAGGSAEGMFDDVVKTERAMEKGAGKEVKLECFAHEGGKHNEAVIEMAARDGAGATNFRMLQWIKEIYA